MLKRTLAAGLVAASLSLLALPAATATAAPSVSSKNECVVHVIGQKPTGEMQLGERHCYSTRTQAMLAEHVGAWGPGAAARAAITATTFVIGLHCDGFNLGSPCTSVVGTGCTGGWLNTSAAWSNRISSTQNGCPTIRHFDGANLTGSVELSTGVGFTKNLGPLNNKTESLQYL